MGECQICSITLTNSRAKICEKKSCKSKWKLARNANLSPVSKECGICKRIFETKDRRNNFCSNSCRVESRKATMLAKYGVLSKTGCPRKASLNSSNYYAKNEHPRRTKFLKERGYSSMETFMTSVHDFCTLHNVAPNSTFCLNHFNMSTYMNRLLSSYNLEEVLHNSYRCSNGERELRVFLDSIEGVGYETNARPKFMGGLELDIYCPKLRVAIEYHGLAFHSERPVFGPKDISKIKKQHELKYARCKDAGVLLVQIFEDEWADSNMIMKSMILNRLKITPNKVFARKTQVRELKSSDCVEFLNSNHINGSVRCKVGFGLFVNGELVSVLTLRGTWNKKYGNVVEIARFASKLNTSVTGGFSKLMKRVESWARANGYPKILTYADCRFGHGIVYAKYGFKGLGKTSPNYFYEKSGKREERFNHRKNNNPEFIKEHGGTERAQNNHQGWYAIYDAGSMVYLLDL